MSRKDHRSYKKVVNDARREERKMRPQQPRLVFDRATRTWQWTGPPDQEIRA